MVVVDIGFPIGCFLELSGRQVEANSRGGSEEHVKRALAARIDDRQKKGNTSWKWHEMA